MNSVQVDLQFTANTANAKNAIRDLQNNLTSLASSANNLGNLSLTPQIQQAQNAALGLKIALDSAVNTDTGKLNLTKFQVELKKSGMSLREYAYSLKALGPQGTQAFTQVAQAIAMADTKMFQFSGKLKQMVDILSSNIMWSITGALIQGVTQAISNTVDYAAKLDESLNNIRIVSGKSAEQMAKFAKEANAAAKALGTTTKNYTDASLIYFQQGLNASEVNERTQATIKLANVTGESVETVSNQLTAIWNNFDDGSKSLEYYADVITKLGAATASSADEISQGLEKFAAIAETVGLSYEYATAALATVTAETRQSADVVGTAFKTIFARLEGLKLGETLDDGTTLNKYSAALGVIGVNIKDANGELRDMDAILEETGQRWQTLSRDQQVALAQAVAGIRQYSHFMSLMENWDVMQNNLDMAANSTGELAAQQAIYNQSVEASKAKMTAVSEQVMSKLFNGDDLKDFYKGLTEILEFSSTLLDSLGGLEGLLLLAAQAMMKMVQPQVANFIDSLIIKAENLVHKTDPKVQAKQIASEVVADTAGGVTQSAVLKEDLTYQIRYQQNINSLSEAEKQRLNFKHQLLQQSQNDLIVAEKQLEKEQEINLALGERLRLGGAEVDTTSQVARAAGVIEQSGKAAKDVFTNAQEQELDLKDEKVRSEMGAEALGELNSMRSNLSSLGIGEAVQTEFKEAEMAIETFVNEGTLDLNEIIQKIESFKQKASELTNQKLNYVSGESNAGNYTAAQRTGNNLLKTFEDIATDPENNYNNDKAREKVARSAGRQIDEMESSLAGTGLNLDFEGLRTELDQFSSDGVGNIEQIVQKIEEMINLIDQANQKELDWGDTGDLSTFDSLEKDIENQTSKVNYDKPEEGEVGGVLSSTITSLSNMQKSTESGGAGVSDERLAALQKEGELLQEQRENLEKNKNTIKDYNGKMKESNKAIQDYQKRVAKTVKQVGNERKARQQNSKVVGEARRELNNYVKTEQSNGRQMKKNEGDLKRLKKGYGQLHAELDNGKNKLKTWGQYGSSVLSGFSSYASGLFMMTSAFDTLSNKIASGNASWQDWLSFAMSMGMVLPQLISGTKSLTSGVTGLVGKIVEWATGTKNVADATKGATAATQQEIVASQEAVVANNAEATANLETAATNEAEATTQQTVNQAEQGEIANTPAVVAADAQQAAGSAPVVEGNVAEAVSGVAAQAGKGPVGWITAATSILMIVGLLATIGFSLGASISSGAKSGNIEKEKENANKNIENSNKNLELIDGNQDLSTSVKDLTEEYKELKAAGEDTMDVFESMTEKIPELIENYSKLENAIPNLDLDIKGLEDAWEFFKLTGDLTAWEGAQTEADRKVRTEKTQQARSKLKNSVKLMGIEGEEGSGYLKDGNFKLDFSNSSKYGISDPVQDILQNSNLSKFDKDNNKVYGVDLSDPVATVEFFNAMKDGLAELEANGIYSGNAYQTLSDNIAEMADAAETAQEALNELYEIAQEDFINENIDAFISQGKTLYGNDADWGDIASFEDYAKHREEILEHLSEAYTITRDQAEALLLQSDEFKNYEIGIEKFANDGAIDLALEQNGFEGGTENQEFLNWWNGLTKEEQILAFNIDYSSVQSIDDLNNKLSVLREKMEENKAIQQAESLGVSTETFESYTDILVDANEHLTENNALTKKIGVAQIAMNKGLSSLAENWDDLSKTLAEGNRNTLEYAEAIGTIKESFETAFGYKPSTSFIEEHLEEIGALIEGDKTKLEELQKLMAEDAIKNIELNVAFDDSVELPKEEIQNSLYAFLNDLDTSLEVGQGTTLSGDYLKTLQAALDSGQLTMDQLNQIMASAGFTMEITDWKEVPGPKETVLTHTKNLTTGEEEEIETISQTMLQVPIINGIDENGGEIPIPTVTRSVDSTSISNSSLKENDGGGGREDKKESEEIERYHEINEEIEDLSAAYDRLSEAKDRAFGKSKLDLMDKEIAKKKELVEAQKEYLKEIEENLKEDLGYALGHGIEIDYESGRIINYDEIIKQKIEEYNSGTLSEEEYTAFKERMEQYEETLNLLEDEQQTFIELQNEIVDLGLEKVNYEIELKLRLADNELDTIEHVLDHLDDSVQDAIKGIDLLSNKTEKAIFKAETYKQGIYDTFAVEGMFTDQEITALLAGDMSVLQGKNLTEEQIDRLEEYSEALLEVNENFYEIYEQMNEQLSTAFDTFNEDMSNQIEAFSHLQSIAQGYKDVIDLLGKDNLQVSNKVWNDLNRASLQTSKDALKSQQQILESNKKILAEAEEALKQARINNDNEAIKMWEDQIEAIKETVTSAEEELMNMWTESLNAAAEAFSSAAQNVLDTFEKSMTGLAGSFENLQSNYEQYSEISQRYLTDYQKIYELNKLNRNIEKSIDNLDSVSAKTRLRDLQLEINKLQSTNNQLTQYELDELKAKYDLRVAEIALEESQNAKNQVRMQRTSEGDWAYIYTTNQAQLDQAQQTYEDKLYAYQKITQDYLINIESQLISVPQEFANAIAQINEDLTLTEEERKQKLDSITEYYTEKYDFLLQELDKAIIDSDTLYNEDWKSYSEHTGYKISAQENWKDKFTETFLAQQLGFKNTEEAHKNFTEQSKELLDNLKEHYELWQKDVDEIMIAAGTTMENFSNKVAEEAVKINNESNSIQKDLISIAQAGEVGFYGLIKSANEYSKQYGTQIQGYLDKNLVLKTSLTEIMTILGTTLPNAVKGWTVGTNEDITKIQDILSGYNKKGSGTVKNQTSNVIEKDTDTDDSTTTERDLYGVIKAHIGDVFSLKPDTPLYAGSYNGKTANTGATVEDLLYETEFLLEDYNVIEMDGKSYVEVAVSRYWDDSTGWHDSSDFTWNDESYFIPLEYLPFDTGGYTGEWGDDGRIAMLHQKEIVLNAKDTENFLTAVNIVREIANVIDLNTLSQMNRLSNFNSTSITPTSQVLEQEVTIHAEFPNATNHSEIEEAFDNLLNRASQFANRKN